MNIFLELAFLFFVGCTLGWCLEVVYRRVVHHRWINPGFLVGPYLPLYGSGLTLMFLLCRLMQQVDTGRPWLNCVLTVLLLTAVMTMLEYITGLIFICGMKIKLWDYSRQWGNIRGIICPLYTLFWGLIGALYSLVLHRYVSGWVAWLSENLAFSFVIGMFFGILLLDAAYSFRLSTRIRRWAKEKQVIVRYEALKESIHDRLQEEKARHHFLFSVKSPRTLREELERYLEKYHR